MTTDYDIAVIGLGAVGAMAAWRAAAAGARVIGFEQFQPGHAHGSSHGGTRIFRRTLFEGVDYVPLIDASKALWLELERETRRTLFTRTGGLVIGPHDEEVVRLALVSAEAGGFEHAVLDSDELASRYPQHTPTPGHVAVFEPGAGVLDPEASIRAAVALARELGGALISGERVARVDGSGADAVITTARGDTVRARRAIVASGAWIGEMVPQLRLALSIQRSSHVWFRGADMSSFGVQRFPVFVREGGGFDLWGIPDVSASGVKIGAGASAPKPALASPGENVRTIDMRDTAPAESACSQGIRGLVARAIRASACMNSRTPDGDFILGVHPAAPALVLAGGFSGHGFKHATGSAQLCVDLALEGASRIPNERFHPTRFDGSLDEDLNGGSVL
ncbi:N-methyl-L-tryptophan oxidase [Microbacterium rhizophilus]|uniref:N-methyl-L-tryptophan oxidase n=1 Tax=Microbacterium rhizophilus TaxID=3138934 RepID=UPI0031ECFD34